MCLLGIGAIFLRSVKKRWDGGGISKAPPAAAGLSQSHGGAAGEQTSFAWQRDGGCSVTVLGEVEPERILAAQLPRAGGASSRPTQVLGIPCRGGCSEVAEDVLISTIFFAVNLFFSGCGLHERSAESLNCC